MRRLRSLPGPATLLLAASVAASAPGDRKTRDRSSPPPLHEKSTAEIIRGYTFVGDFSQHPEDRPVSDEVFWRYPYVLPKAEFPIETVFTDLKRELPSTHGSGRPVEHLNRGRVLFLDKQFDQAKATWLSARARFGKDYPFHRRNDYFVGYAFLNLADGIRRDKGLDWGEMEVKGAYANAATFLSWAFIVKVDHPDPLVEAVTPKGLYNLAAIYWRYGRHAGAFGAADTGLNFLRKTGRKEYRPAFHRLMAEAHIINRSYLEAARELDTAIRQDPEPVEAAAAFARVGDMYFDLNNYELAEDAYGMGAKIDEDHRRINPTQLVMRGESLFWLGRFSEAQKILHFALNGGNFRDQAAPLAPATASWASLRIADAFLARRQLDDARLAYYKVGHEYRGSVAGRLAKMRSACLELPYYGGNNVAHARELLEEAKTGPDMPRPAQELAWACQVGSYTDRERTPEMLGRVRDFAGAYPESGFLKTFVEPVREFQASQIEAYFKTGDLYSVVSFFEKNRRSLFPKIAAALAERLFAAYADVYRSGAAAEFWDAYRRTPDSDLKTLRLATVAAELADQRAGDPWWRRNEAFILELPKRAWRLPPEKTALAYVGRLRQVKTLDRHLPWLQRLAETWGAQDTDLICDLEYPLLSRMATKGGALRARAEARNEDLVGRLLPGLFRHDESCALSLLELESTRLKGPGALSARYLARRDWPLVGGFLHLFWTMSEHAYDRGDRAGARAMWEVLRDKGPPGSPEVGFAKARLDPTRTEFESLWN